MNGGALISGYFDGTLSDAEVAELQAWIVAEPANAKLFAKHAMLHQQMGVMLSSERTLRIEEAHRRATTSSTEAQSKTYHEFQAASRWTTQRLEEIPAASANRRKLFGRIAAVAAALVLCIGGVSMWNHPRAAVPEAAEEEAVLSQDPASITHDFAVVWSDQSNRQLRDLKAGQSLTLVAGHVELTFAAGAKVIIEGPATFTINSATELTVDSGKLTAKVEGGGFVVHTPAARVTDLGTEFGIVVREHAGTVVKVYKGKVNVEGTPGPETAAMGTAPAAVHMLTAGDCAKIDEGAFAMVPLADGETLVRDFSSLVTSLDLVDMLCGGDGTTQHRGVGIDVATGNAGALKQVEREAGDDHYHRVPKIAVMDGCFVPDGTPGPNQVDSGGHTYRFPGTSKLSQGLVWAGGRPEDPYGNGLSNAILGATDFSASGHAPLYMYSNKGVTLDLTKVRHPAGAGDVCAFRATVGNTYLKMMRLQRTFPKSDIFVLVDGEVRFKWIGFLANSGPFTLKVPLKPEDHYLTLAVCDGGDTRKDDYIVWGDAAVELMPPKSSVASIQVSSGGPAVEKSKSTFEGPWKTD